MTHDYTSPHASVSDIVSHIPYFRDVPAAVQQSVAQHAHVVHAKRDAVIVRRGEPCNGVHIVVLGRVKLCCESASGLERVMRIVGADDSFGEALATLGRPYVVSAEALCDTDLLYVPAHVLMTQMAASAALAEQLVRSLAQHYYMLMGDVSAYTVHTGHQRLIGYLLREAQAHQGTSFRLSVPKGVVASRLNLTPQHFSRILHDLIERELISVQGRDFTVLDEPGLRAYQNLSAS
ncbi:MULTISPECIES: Crp/Fnr family transcriptional regulator [unclassified Castellaniella]|uniref:Crp/Fnr family transcriptional regulator n=1 Tax=unclassified Castellaniella TaxID=2617606 RepID=UPI00331486AB